MFQRSTAVSRLPDGYREDYQLTVTDDRQLLKLNLLSLVLIIPFGVLLIGWRSLVEILRGPLPVLDVNLPSILLWIGVLLVLPLHEWVHGVFIRWTGHRPRYGIKGFKLGPVLIPYVLYATTDDGFFWRNQFIVIALAPVVLITFGAMILLVFVPDPLVLYVIVAAVINGSGASGDLWMAVVTLRYPADVLVKDEADSIRIFERGGENI